MNKEVSKIAGDINLSPVHPGKTLRSELKIRKLSATSLSLKLMVPQNRITEITRGVRSITPDTALRLGKAFGNGGRFWLQLQTNYDLAMAQLKFGAIIEQEVEVISLCPKK